MCIVFDCTEKVSTVLVDKGLCCCPSPFKKALATITSVVLALVALASIVGFALLVTGVIQLPEVFCDLPQLTYVGIGLIIGMVSLVLSSACWKTRNNISSASDHSYSELPL